MIRPESIHPLLSDVAASCLFTMGVAARHDPRQKVPESPTYPAKDIRKLRAQLIFEEAMETITALGFTIGQTGSQCELVERNDEIYEATDPDILLEHVIDGCCDTIYVAVGTLMAMGVADVPHMAEVNACNDAKFPDGVAIMNPATGKYLKPKDWKPPNHRQHIETMFLDLSLITEQLVRSMPNG